MKTFFFFFFFFSIFFFLGGGVRSGGGEGVGGHRVDVNKVFVKIKKKKIGWVGLGGGSGWM